MEEIRRLDRKLFFREATSPGRLLVYAVAFGLLYAFFTSTGGFRGPGLFGPIGPAILVIAALWTAWQASERKRFHHPRLRAMWAGCEDRLVRFEEGLRKLRRDQRADLREMPKTIRKVAENLYVALRKADVIAHEVRLSEQDIVGQPPVWNAQAGDAQSRELYRQADKNIAEYRSHFAAVMAGVERTEAQSAVFMTTLDTLRMRMMGYLLVGRRPEMDSRDFLESLAEARAQFQAIDTALEELDLGHYPKMIAATPPPMPSEEQIQARLDR